MGINREIVAVNSPKKSNGLPIRCNIFSSVSSFSLAVLLGCFLPENGVGGKIFLSVSSDSVDSLS